MKPYRVTMALKVDVWAESENMAEDIATESLIEDHIPWYIVEMLGATVDELDLAVDVTDGSWDPVNDDDIQ